MKSTLYDPGIKTNTEAHTVFVCLSVITVLHITSRMSLASQLASIKATILFNITSLHHVPLLRYVQIRIMLS